MKFLEDTIGAHPCAAAAIIAILVVVIIVLGYYVAHYKGAAKAGFEGLTASDFPLDTGLVYSDIPTDVQNQIKASEIAAGNANIGAPDVYATAAGGWMAPEAGDVLPSGAVVPDTTDYTTHTLPVPPMSSPTPPPAIVHKKRGMPMKRAHPTMAAAQPAQPTFWQWFRGWF